MATMQSGLMSAADKTKLDGIAAGAQVNPGVATTSADGLMSKADKSKLDGIASGAQVNPSVATTSADGLMSKADKSKLDGIASGAQVNTLTGVKGNSESAYRTGNVNLTAANIGAAASTHSHTAATTSADGFMSKADKSKLDGIASGAQVNTLTGVKGNSESAYRTGNVNLTAANIGAAASTHSHTAATTSADGFMSKADKTKLDGIASGAQVNTLTGVKGNSESAYRTGNVNLTAANIGAAASTHSHTAATTSADGFMSKSDKTKLDGIASGAQVNPSVATTSADGLMSKADKSKLDGIAASANNYAHPTQNALTGVPTANQTPGFGGSFTVSQPSVNTLGHVTALTSRTITIPSTAASTTAAGLMSKDDKVKLNGIAAGAQVNPSLPLSIANGGTGTTSLDNVTVGMAKTVGQTIAAATVADVVKCQMGSDAFRIRVGGESNESNWAEIAIGDDGSEPIYVRQYGWVSPESFGTIKREAALLDAAGNTSFPGTITCWAINPTVWGVCKSVSYTDETYNADLNNFNESGVYRLDYLNNWNNRPGDAAGIRGLFTTYLRVLGSSGAGRTQILFAYYGENDVWYRRFFNGAWDTKWARINAAVCDCYSNPTDDAT